MACPMRFVLLGISLVLAAFAWITMGAEHAQLHAGQEEKGGAQVRCLHAFLLAQLDSLPDRSLSWLPARRPALLYVA